ncbi:MAG: anthranilate phosphoribosyltransferase [Burkholderiales bacterium]|nr:anthranilate phosphoribosyltransferase [Burkholderiales bacterium]
MTPHQALARVIEHREIFHEEMLDLMRQIMRGEVSPVLISAILLGLRVKKETLGEIAAAATVQREFATRVEVADPTHLVDTCGTGGDGAHTFNISTAAAFVVAAAGGRVAKHGGRSVSSRSGSADVLEALGVNLSLSPAAIAQCIDTEGLGFMFAPNHHGAMKHAAPVRRELGVRTLFNILGPLTNPAGAPNQVLGVFHPDLVGILVRVLQRLGSRHVLVVHGMDGLDELSLSGETLVGELVDGEVREYVVRPADFGLAEVSRTALRADDAQASKALVLQALDGVPGAAQDIVALNAGAALYAAGRAASHRDGIALAFATIASGAARRKLESFAARTQALAA